MAIVKLSDVWKQFRIPHQRRYSVLDELAGLHSSLRGDQIGYEEFWALKDVTLTVSRGESLGIVGPNGSGKSTLLKLIAGILNPNRGRIETSGTVAPILELGIGFHPNLTVRDNIAVYGVIMGLSRSQIRSRTESVLEFSDLTRFQDAQLRTLSTGMTVRLGFSIAIQSDPDIFLVDEALAVGDLDFQKKCLDKFRDFKKAGKSIIVVSHNLELIRGFCDRALYLLGGEVKALTSSTEAVTRYMRDLHMKPHGTR